MKVLFIQKDQLKAVTLFLIEKEIIFHPTISPNGFPDFTGKYGRRNLLIIDRNIMTKIIEFCRSGKLNDAYIRKIISALIFWAEFNDVEITSGLALNEYAIVKGTNEDASLENNIFLRMFHQYSPQVWLDVFEGSVNNIAPIEIDSLKNYNFAVENDHYLMHLSEMLCLFRLYLTPNLEPYQKVMKFLSWVDANQLLCAYSVNYACMLFAARVKQPKLSLEDTFDIKLKKCANQAWDLSYLSFWSTLYWQENNSNTNHLFATMDADLKKVFINTHDDSNDIFVRFFGKNKGLLIRSHYSDIISRRVKPTMSDKKIHAILEKEKSLLATQSYA